ncbi:hypothetical protein C8R44DRAFT_741805 [Mycena epipterygia]|nr:hypothetical protein C8R44DRAFT_741805 [Mycena epipterygia]
MPQIVALTAAQDKAFKHEALHHRGGPVNAPLQRWLDNYLLPTKPTAAPRQSFYERKEAEFAAKKARRDTLDEMRARGEKVANRRWPRLRRIAEDKENLRVATLKKEAARLAAVRGELEHKRERAAADARVAELMRLHALRRPRVTSMAIGALPHARPYARRRHYWLFHMPASPLDNDIIWEIAFLSSASTCTDLLLLSFGLYTILRPLLYRNIVVGDPAGQLIRSLAHDASLPPLVKSLVFRDSEYTYIDEREWVLVLPAMVNLRTLVVAYHVPLDRAILPSITFRLRLFISTCTVFGAWADLLFQQPDLEEIRFYVDFFGPVPSAAELPHLRSVMGRPEDLGRFVRQHSLQDVWFYLGPPWARHTLRTIDLTRFACSSSRLLTLRITAKQLLMLMDQAPAAVYTMLHLVLDEDLSWCRLGPESLIIHVARRLAADMPALRSLTLCTNVLKRDVPVVQLGAAERFPFLRRGWLRDSGEMGTGG